MSTLRVRVVLPTPITVGVGDNVRAVRHRAGISKSELARRSRHRVDYIDALESGSVDASLDDLARVAGALGVHVRRFWAGILE